MALIFFLPGYAGNRIRSPGPGTQGERKREQSAIEAGEYWDHPGRRDSHVKTCLNGQLT